MARSFNGSTDFIAGGECRVSNLPLTLSAKINLQDRLVISSCFGVFNSSNGASNYITTSGSTSRRFRAQTRTDAAAFSQATSTVEHFNNVWYQVTAVFSSSTNRIIYHNTTKTSDTINRATSGFDIVRIGCRTTTGVNVIEPANATLAELGIWNIALNDEDVAQLVSGANPSQVRSNNLVMYVPLIRDMVDIVGGVTLTATGTGISEHPRIYY